MNKQCRAGKHVWVYLQRRGPLLKVWGENIRSTTSTAVNLNVPGTRRLADLNLLVHVVSPKFVAGLVCQAGVVQDAPPIARYMVGWPLARVLTYAHEKAWLTHVGVVGTDGRTRWPLDLNCS